MALKIEELRVGNWIWQLHTRIQTQVSLFMLGEISDDETYLDHLFPIPLSGEVLEACGFEYNEKMDRYVKQPEMENIEYRVKEVAGGWRVSKGFFKWDDELTLIHYLHELQNVYFAIQQGELTYNPSK